MSALAAAARSARVTAISVATSPMTTSVRDNGYYLPQHAWLALPLIIPSLVWPMANTASWLISLGDQRHSTGRLLAGIHAEATMTKGQKLLLALQLHDLGVEMKKMQLKRKNPTATPAELQELYSQWVRREGR